MHPGWWGKNESLPCLWSPGAKCSIRKVLPARKKLLILTYFCWCEWDVYLTCLRQTLSVGSYFPTNISAIVSQPGLICCPRFRAVHVAQLHRPLHTDQFSRGEPLLIYPTAVKNINKNTHTHTYRELKEFIKLMDSPWSTVNSSIWISTSSGVLMAFFLLVSKCCKTLGKSVNQGLKLIWNKSKMTQGFNCPGWVKGKKVNKHFVIHDGKQIGASPMLQTFFRQNFHHFHWQGQVWVPWVGLSDWKSSKASRTTGQFWTSNWKQPEGGWFSEHFTYINLGFLEYLHPGNKKSDVEVVLPQTTCRVVFDVKNNEFSTLQWVELFS